MSSTVSSPIVNVEIESEIKSLQTIFTGMKTLFEKLKLDLEANRSTQTLTKVIRINRNMLEVLLLLQVKTKKNIKNYEESLAVLQSRISTKSELPKKAKKIRKTLLKNELTKRSNGKLSYYFQLGVSHHEKDSPDYEEISTFKHKFLSCLPQRKSWRVSDAKHLTNGIIESLRLQKLEELLLILRNSDEVSEERLILLEEELNFLKHFSSQTEGSSFAVLLSNEPLDREYNWNFISKKFLKNRFTGTECRSIWFSVANPLIRNDPWKPEEDLLLRQIAIENELQNWDKINELLPTKRSAFLCFIRYQTKFKSRQRVIRNIWFDKENSSFEKEIEKKSFSFNDFISKLVVQHQDKSKKQIISHFRYKMSMRRKTLGSFSRRERFLINSFASRRYSYHAIAQILGTRTPKQIKDYHSALKERKICGKWNANEIRNLLKSIKYFGEKNWNRVSKLVKGRSSTQCRQKFMMLKTKRKDLIDNYFKKDHSKSETKLNKISNFLKSEQNMMKDKVFSRRKSVNMKIESYFVRTLQAKMYEKSADNETQFVNCIFSLLDYLSLNVSHNNQFKTEIFNWLTHIFTSNNSSLPFDNIFIKSPSSNNNNNFRYCGRCSVFSHVVNKCTNLLPPNKCTIHGYNMFMKNYESYAKLNENINFSEMWKNINTNISKNKKFLEAKIFWYQILKSFFYWPIKLKSISVEELLTK